MTLGLVADVFFLEREAAGLALGFFFRADIKLRYHPASRRKWWASNELHLFDRIWDVS